MRTTIILIHILQSNCESNGTEKLEADELQFLDNNTDTVIA